MKDTAIAESAIVLTLLNDNTLTALLPDGVYWDAGAPTLTRFALISLVDHVDEDIYGSDGFETAVYLVKAVVKSTAGADVDRAAARIHELLQGPDLASVLGSPTDYRSITLARQRRIRDTEIDEQDPNIRWQHRGGHYEAHLV